MLKQHHQIVLPKAVQYTAGLMDYFFRGKLEVKIQWNMDSQDYTLEITNKSGTALKGGAFTLYADDFIGTRSGVSLEVDHGSWNANSVLENDEMITATF